jgi:hypothetical protein
MWSRVSAKASSVIECFFVNWFCHVVQRVSKMIGRWLGSRTRRADRAQGLNRLRPTADLTVAGLSAAED